MEDKIWGDATAQVTGADWDGSPGWASPVDTQSSCRPLCSFRLLPLEPSGPAHSTLDTLALVLFSHAINHLAPQSHWKAFPRRSLQGRRRSNHSQLCWENRWSCGETGRQTRSHSQLDERVQVGEKLPGQELDVVVG